MGTSVNAFSCKVSNLLDGQLHRNNTLLYPLKIDRYQRPFVWSEKKVRQLIKDLQSHQKGAYYLGSILLHERNDEHKKGLFVIDGQQRLTTLLLIYNYLKIESAKNDHLSLSYYHKESVQNIRNAHSLINREIPNGTRIQGFKRTLDNLEITLIITDDIDLAFTFFDSQNSRGVRLKSTDLLKSYHLREINQLESGNTDNRQYLERNSAKRWEHLQTFKGVLSTEHDFAFELFHKLIWRARRWRGEQVEKEQRDTVIEEFQEGTVQDRTGTIPLYPNRQNMLSEYLVETKEEGLKRSGGQIRVTDKSSNLPFILRQPIHSGLHYFLFAEKYAELIYELYKEETNDPEIEKFQKYVESIVDENSYYLKELFLVCTVTYYDKYGTNKLFEFAELLGLAHGIKRLEQHYIFRQSAFKYMREYNLIDIISHSFLPEEVIASLKNHILPNRKERLTSHVDLTDEDYDGVLDKSGVNERCFNAFHRYYDVWWDEMTGSSDEQLDLTQFAEEILNKKANNEGG
ncbi:MAG: DUF262 domain-containing protein [Bacteroidetes bacterium]|jgi:hypothetical protein|nr:DUF262 domain-containing protein [Bacteroidota bacterium]